jgi:hypothetical protein
MTECLHFSSIKETQLIYNESARVKNLFGMQFSTTDTIIYHDTALLDCTFDSLFVSPIKPKSNIYDSLGNIIEFVTYYGSHTIGGDITYSNNKPQFIHRLTYNRDGKPEIFNTYTGDNKLIRSVKYFYNNSGLLLAKQVDNSNSIICYIFNSE